MKLVTYSRDEGVSCGILTDSGVIDIPLSIGGTDAPRSVKEVLERGSECLERLSVLAVSAKEFIPVGSVKFLAPVPGPNKVLALAGNYGEHIKEVGLKLGLSDSVRRTTVPRPFLMPCSVVTGPDEKIPWPVYSEQIDYEIELAVVIGKRAKCISPENALGAVGGYTIANDVSARSVSFKQGRSERPWDEFFDWLNGKWSDCFLPMGPYLLTADEVGDVQNLEMTLAVNGEVRQEANTGEMIFPVAEVISFLSHIMTLEAGDIIATGTPAGVAAATGRFLEAGDSIECKIEKLGMLRNTVGEAPHDFYKPVAG